MWSYLVRKLIQIPVVVFGVVVALFALIHVAPGDPIAALIGDSPATPQYIAEMRSYFGLDRPLPEQFVIYLTHLAQGDLGTSYFYSEPVLKLILERLPATALLMAAGLTAATVAGVVLGIIAGARPNSVVDLAANLLAVIGYSLPVFWLAQLLLLIFALYLGWLPTQGMTSLREPREGFAAVVDRAQHLFLPALVLATRYVAVDFRLTRSGVLEALGQEYTLTARAKGLPPRLVLFRHALRNALLPVVTVTGLNVGFALSGAALTEVVFGWPGVGRLTLDAIYHRDSPVLLGIVICLTTVVVLVNFITDMVYAMVDPRIRLAP